MTAPALEILEEAERFGVAVELKGEGVVIRPASLVPPAVRARWQAHKAELARLLRGTFQGYDHVRVVFEEFHPVRGPIRHTPWCTINDPTRCIEADLDRLPNLIAATLAGHHDLRPAIDVLRDEADEVLERLRACGCRVRLEVVS